VSDNERGEAESIGGSGGGSGFGRPSPAARARRFALRVRALSRKEWMHISRDAATVGFAAVMPLLLLVIFGFAVSFDVDHIRAVVVDEDHSAASRELGRRLFSGPTFEDASGDAGRLASAADVEPLFRRRVASVALVIPRHFEQQLQRGEPAPVQLLVDAADNVTAGSVMSYAARFVARVNQDRSAAVVGRSPAAIDARVRALFNPGMRSAIFLVPGLVALIQAIMAVLLTSLTVAREWERGSMEQLFSTPVGRLEIVLGKLAPYFVVALFQLLMILVAATWIFDVPVRGSLPALFGLSSLFLYAALAQGLLISVVTRNQQVATQAAAVSSILPSMLLSGFALPIDNMPVVLQWVTNIVPARHYVDAIRAIMLRDVEASALGGDALALFAVGTVLLAVATRRFPRRIA
jgi:ABC-2 type transport system permease protein